MTQINGYDVVGRMPIFTHENRDLVRSGVKTQTRRVMKPQPIDLNRSLNCSQFKSRGVMHKCPYGYPGDVRVMPEPLHCGRTDMWFGEMTTTYYSDDKVECNLWWGWDSDSLSSMFMPTVAGRTLVRYTNIRVERLQDISAKDAMAEGWPGANDTTRLTIDALGNRSITGLAAIDWYAQLWNSINGKTYPWDSNPWVWCIEWELL